MEPALTFYQWIVIDEVHVLAKCEDDVQYSLFLLVFLTNGNGIISWPDPTCKHRRTPVATAPSLCGEITWYLITGTLCCPRNSSELMSQRSNIASQYIMILVPVLEIADISHYCTTAGVHSIDARRDCSRTHPGRKRLQRGGVHRKRAIEKNGAC